MEVKVKEGKITWDLHRTKATLARGDGISPGKRNRCLEQVKKLEDQLRLISTQSMQTNEQSPSLITF
jgi:hypothetical protein